VTDDAPALTVSGPPTLAEIGPATIVGIYDEPVLLFDGIYEGERFDEGGSSRRRVELLDHHASGELTASPGDETAVFLSESSGGSGTLLYLARIG
jgi:hypothetical protein